MNATEQGVRRKFVGVTQGMCGWTAVLYDSEGPIVNWGVYHNDREDAAQDARDWAEADGLELEAGL